MKFDSDDKFTSFRTIVLMFCLSILIIPIFLIRDFKYKNGLILALSIFIFILLRNLFLLPNSISKAKNILIVKNVFGLTIKQIKIHEILGRKIIFKQVPFNGIGIMKLMGLTEIKYEKFIFVKLDIKNGKKYNFNGQILTMQGLQKFNDLVK